MKIFLDIDGVLANFEKHLSDVYKIDIKVDGNENIPWDFIGHEFYSSIPLFEGAKGFYKELTSRFQDVYLLSGTILTPGCYSGKADWLKNSLGENLYDLRKLILCLSKTKYLLSGSNRFLIDDFGRNIKEWVSAGGVGIKINKNPTYKTWDNILNFLKLYPDIWINSHDVKIKNGMIVLYEDEFFEVFINHV